jgi:hypothetical protein
MNYDNDEEEVEGDVAPHEGGDMPEGMDFGGDDDGDFDPEDRYH